MFAQECAKKECSGCAGETCAKTKRPRILHVWCTVFCYRQLYLKHDRAFIIFFPQLRHCYKKITITATSTAPYPAPLAPPLVPLRRVFAVGTKSFFALVSHNPRVLAN